MQFLFASGQVSVFGNYLSTACRGKFALLLFLFICFSAYSRSLLTLKAKTLFSLLFLCFAFCVKVRSH